MKLEMLCPYNYPEQHPPVTNPYFVIVKGWPNDFNGPTLLIGDYTTGDSYFQYHKDKWRIVDLWADYSEGYDFVSGEHVIAWGYYPTESDL